ncbi:MAG: UDP-N-acetylmuramate dehydrogenase [Trueperaceae bacterium]|nr:UDP-N-acetylmuramate dehydrogenase [Trueperaceae bacterium]
MNGGSGPPADGGGAVRHGVPGARVTVRPLAGLTTLRVGGPAEVWEVDRDEAVREATRAPFRVIGAGSNLLVADAGVDDRVVKLGRAYDDVRTFGEKADVWLGAATPLPGLVRRAQRAGLSGLEGLLGVPAVLGGAVAMNAGTRFGELSDVLREVELMIDGRVERLPAGALRPAYRRAHLPSGAVVLRARLTLTPSTPEAVAEAMRRVDAAREGQPKIKSAGCAFKNPPGDSAGRIIDAAGLKGLRVGDAMVAFEHGNFIVNLGRARAEDVRALLDEVRARAGVPLELEWRSWGWEG